MAITTNTETLDNMYTTTWMSRKKQVSDSIMNARPFYAWLNAGGRVTRQSGGREIERPTEYAVNSTGTFLSGAGDTISTADTEILSVSQWAWKYAAVSIVRYWRDDQMNKGKSAFIKLASAKMENAKNSLIELFEEYLHKDGTGYTNKAFDGLGNIVPETNTNTVGGINRTTYTWWKNQIKAATGSYTVYLIPDLSNLCNTCSQGNSNERPDFHITSQTNFEYFQEEYRDYYQFENKKAADLGFQHLTFEGNPVTWSSYFTPSDDWVAINSKHMELVIDTDNEFDMDEWKFVPNTPKDRVAQICFVGNLISDAPRYHGRLYDITT